MREQMQRGRPGGAQGAQGSSGATQHPRQRLAAGWLNTASGDFACAWETLAGF